MTEDQRLFLADAQEIVDRLYHDLDELRGRRHEGRRRRELAAQIFRRVHTLKGSAGTLGFGSITGLAHEFEGVLDVVRLGRLEISDEVLDTFEDALDQIAQRLLGRATAKPESDSTSIVERLGRLIAESGTRDSVAPSLRSLLPPEVAHSLSEYDLQHAREAISEGAKLFLLSAIFNIETFDRDFRDLTGRLGQSGEIIATMPGAAPAADEINFRLLYAAEFIAPETLPKSPAQGRIECREIPVAGPDAEAQVSLPVASQVRLSLAKPVESSVSVELKQLDELISNAAELFRQTTSALAMLGGPAKADLVEATAKSLRGRFAELEQRLLKLRLVPISEIFERVIARTGRVVARQAGKSVEFEIHGGDVGIEKSLAEVITDPLFHLVRNAVTHGLEDPASRAACGKNPTGKITLTAANHSGRIQITVADDGRGIDLERVIATANQHGIAGPDLSVDQCLRLIFRPGFSTSSEASQMSGRGIGLDVVDRAMDLAGGEARVATEQGAGTTFAMIMPAALSMMRCLLIRSGGQTYALDTAELSYGPPPLDALLRKLTLLELESLLGYEGKVNDERPCVVWRTPASQPNSNGHSPREYKISVDEIIGTQEVLVRGLGRYASRWRGLSGAAELLDGTIALVLDLEELIRLNEEPSA
jgi:two-component system chemotaxis sensor kinase CheA